MSELTPQHVRSLYTLMMELYILLAYAVAERWRTEEELEPFRVIQLRLAAARQQEDIFAFVDASFAIMQAAYPFADNPYLQQTLENLRPAIARTYYIALERRRGQMGQFGEVFNELLGAVVVRDQAKIRDVLTGYCQQNCELVLAALAER
ncbi:FCD domain protein [compost metagenome]